MHVPLKNAGGLVIAVVACGVLEVAAAQEVQIAPLFKPKDEFTIEIKHVREDSGRPAQNSTVVSTTHIRVVEAAGDGFLLDWIPGDSRLEGGDPALNRLLRAAAETCEGLHLRVKLSADGEFVGLANEEQVVSQLQKATDVIVRGLLEKTPEPERAAIQKFIGQIISPAYLIASVTRDVQTYFSLNGISLTPGESVSVDTEQPNPLGGDPFPAKFRVALESATGDSATLTTATTYDGAALLRTVRRLLEQAGKRVSDEEAAKFSFQMSDDGRFVFDRNLGLMKEMTINRRLALGDQRRLERWEIRLVRPPPR